jgi:IS5 family transposase
VKRCLRFFSNQINAVESHKARGKQAAAVQSSEPRSDGDEEPPPGGSGETGADGASVAAEEGSPQGKLILDATVAPQAIRYPTDLSLLNEAREFSEQIIDRLYAKSGLKKKPRTYREKGRRAYLLIAKQRRPSAKLRRKGIKQQLQYLRRNLKHIEALLEHFAIGEPLPLPNWLLYRYWVIQHLYEQQWEMYRTKSRRCDDRIVSISQPYVRPIVRGKQDKPVEFGAKLSVSLTEEGLASVDELRWDAFYEGNDLPAQVEAYKQRYGYYPEVVLGDPVYGTRENRRWLKARGLRFAGKPLGRPKKETQGNRAQLRAEKAQRREEYLQRIPIEGKFGQGKNGYRLNYIRAKRADTSYAWINSIFLVMNLLVLWSYFLVRILSRLWKARSAAQGNYVRIVEPSPSLARRAMSVHPVGTRGGNWTENVGPVF